MVYPLRTRTPVAISNESVLLPTKRKVVSKETQKNKKVASSQPSKKANLSKATSGSNGSKSTKTTMNSAPVNNFVLQAFSIYHLAKRQLDRGTFDKVCISETTYDKEKTTFDLRMAGRDEERSHLESFWEKHVEARLPGSLYISGQPGTGKTALIKEWVSEKQPQNLKKKPHNKDSLHVLHFNCVSVSGPRNFIPALLESLSISTSDNTEDPFDTLKATVLSGKRGFYVVILDELDHLLNQSGGGLGQEILYQLFELVHLQGSKLALVGIANDLNLTDRFLPRLRARGIEPQRLKFMPYGVEQIKSILEKLLTPIDKEASRRYTELNIPPQTLFHPAALEFCSRKVAGSSGDLRRALDLCRQALTLAEAASADPLKPTSDVPIPVPVSISHILEAEKASMGSPTFKKVSELSVHAQVILVAALNTLSQKTPLLANKIYDQYYKLCEDSDLLQALSRSEFGDMLVLLDTLGLLASAHGTPAPKKNFKAGQIRTQPPLSLLVLEDELRKALSKIDLVRPLLL